MAATTCNPLTIPPPCIPFMFPDDGCWGRAHEMCRLMIAVGEQPNKIWIQGNLNVATRTTRTVPCTGAGTWHRRC
jgi:hypothetical protein